MGIIASKLNEIIDENFDGLASDHNVEPFDVSSTGKPYIKDDDLYTIQSQLDHLDQVPEIVDPFSFKNQVVAGKCVKVYDGDTAHFAIFYNGHWVRRRFRLIGFNSPEIRGGTLEEKARAIAARDYLAERLLDKKVLLYLYDFDKWGRVLCDVYLPDLSGEFTSDKAFATHVNSEMIKVGHGIPYVPK